MWQVIYDEFAKKQLSKLDRKAQSDILRYMRERIGTSNDPRRFGKALFPTSPPCYKLSLIVIASGSEAIQT